MIKHIHPHKKENYLCNRCTCVFCSLGPDLCDCEGCKGIPEKKFKVTSLFFDKSEPEYCEGNKPPYFLSTRAPGSTMDCSWFWDEYILTLEINAYRDTDYSRITRIE